MSSSNRYANGAFISFGIAIGYAGGFVPEQYLWVLTVGLTTFAIVYLIIALHSHDRKVWSDYGLQTLILAVAAIGPLTARSLSAVWAILFVILGCICMVLDIAKS